MSIAQFFGKMKVSTMIKVFIFSPYFLALGWIRGVVYQYYWSLRREQVSKLVKTMFISLKTSKMRFAATRNKLRVMFLVIQSCHETGNNLMLNIAQLVSVLAGLNFEARGRVIKLDHWMIHHTESFGE